jgi:hypothetical protein
VSDISVDILAEEEKETTPQLPQGVINIDIEASQIFIYFFK